MITLTQSQIGILSGEALLFADFENGGPMWTGEGDREVRHKVVFDTPFAAAPSVTVSLALIDMSRDAHIRADLRAETITQLGFEIVFRTWGDSRVARVRAAWQAIGAAVTEEGWDG